MVTPSSGVEQSENALGILLDDTMAIAAKKVLKFHFQRMMRNESGTIEGVDIECLHDMRVATRRMRAAFDLFQPYYDTECVSPYLFNLKRTARYLGKVRDLDVQINNITTYLGESDRVTKQDVSDFLLYLTNRREKARAKMIGYLESHEYVAFKDKFKQYVNDPKLCVSMESGCAVVGDEIPRVILSRYEKVKQYDQIIPQAKLIQLHQLRIAFKGLRYSVEFFRDVLGDSVELVIKHLKNIQDHLGDLNDAHVGISVVRKFIRKWEKVIEEKPIVARTSLQPIILYLAYLYEVQHRLLISFPEKWEHFAGDQFEKALLDSISSL